MFWRATAQFSISRMSQSTLQERFYHNSRLFSEQFLDERNTNCLRWFDKDYTAQMGCTPNQHRAHTNETKDLTRLHSIYTVLFATLSYVQYILLVIKRSAGRIILNRWAVREPSYLPVEILSVSGLVDDDPLQRLVNVDEDTVGAPVVLAARLSVPVRVSPISSRTKLVSCNLVKLLLNPRDSLRLQSLKRRFNTASEGNVVGHGIQDIAGSTATS